MLTDCNFIVGFLVFSVLVSFGQVACLLVKSLAGCKPLIGWLARLRAWWFMLLMLCLLAEDALKLQVVVHPVSQETLLVDDQCLEADIDNNDVLDGIYFCSTLLTGLLLRNRFLVFAAFLFLPLSDLPFDSTREMDSPFIEESRSDYDSESCEPIQEVSEPIPIFRCSIHNVYVYDTMGCEACNPLIYPVFWWFNSAPSVPEIISVEAGPQAGVERVTSARSDQPKEIFADRKEVLIRQLKLNPEDIVDKDVMDMVWGESGEDSGHKPEASSNTNTPFFPKSRGPPYWGGGFALVGFASFFSRVGHALPPPGGGNMQ